MNDDEPPVPKAPELKTNLPPHPGTSDDVEPNEYQRMGIAYTVPIALIAPVILLTGIGAWLDRRFHTGTWCTLGGAVLGFVCGMINMIRLANRLNR